VIPTDHPLYEDAKLHMKKEKAKSEDKLHYLIEKYTKIIVDLNNVTEEEGNNIYNMIEQKSKEFTIGPVAAKGKKEKIIKGLLEPRNQLMEGRNLSDWIEDHRQYMTGLDDDLVKRIIDICEQKEFTDSISKIKIKHDELMETVTKINHNSRLISEAIDSEYYDEIADCCPTYFTMLRRFF
jgi:hypothetical protein